MMKILFCLFVVLFNMNFWVSMNLMFLMSGLVLFFFFPLNNVIYSFIYVDSLSYYLVLLSLWIVGLMFLASEMMYFKNNFKLIFKLVVLFLSMFLILSFFSNNLLLFYIFFEISLIPTFLLIFGWGYQPERVQAGFYLLFYTLVASLPLLIGIFYLYFLWGSLSFFFENSFSLLGFMFKVNFCFFSKITNIFCSFMVT